jgi:hypothetical protein
MWKQAVLVIILVGHVVLAIQPREICTIFKVATVHLRIPSNYISTLWVFLQLILFLSTINLVDH